VRALLVQAFAPRQRSDDLYFTQTRKENVGGEELPYRPVVLSKKRDLRDRAKSPRPVRRNGNEGSSAGKDVTSDDPQQHYLPGLDRKSSLTWGR